MLEPKLQKVITEILSENFTGKNFADISLEEWREVFSFSGKLNLHVLIYTLLRKNKIELPDTISSEMKKTCYYACAADFKRKKQIEETIRLFNSHGIGHILLKGAALINTIYKDSFCRIMCDIDVLVRKADADKAYELLLENGYNGFGNYRHLKDAFCQHYPVLSKSGCLGIELHTYISEHFDVNLEGIWDRSQVLEIEELKTRIMSPEDSIMHIALHSFLHHGALNGLTGLYDICSILKNTKINLDTLKELTSGKEYNNSTCVYLALFLAKKLLKFEVSEELFKFLEPDSFPDNMENTVMELLFSGCSIDDDSFALGRDIYRNRRWGLTVFRKMFISSHRLAYYYGRRRYDNQLTVKNLSLLYIRRILILIKRSFSAVFKHLKHRKDASLTHAVELEKFKSWLGSPSKKGVG